MKALRKTVRIMTIAAAWLAVWVIIYLAVGKELIVPSPWSVFLRILSLGATGEFWLDVGGSLLRIMIGFAIAVIMGALTGIATARVRILDSFLSPAAKVIRATPVASFIILLFVFVAKNNIPAVTAFLMVLPVVWVNVYEGIKSTDKKLLEMAKVFELSRPVVIRKIYFPHIKPFFIAAVKTGVGLSWKAGIAAEVIVNPKYGIGSALHDSKVYLETTDLFAWTAVVIIISIILEKVIVALIRGGRAGADGNKAS